MSNTFNLQERAMLASFHSGQWSSTKTDQAVSADTNDRYDAQKNAGRYTKVLAAPKFMAEITQVIRTAKAKHDQLTRPWEAGADILNAAAFSEYTTTMRLARQNVEARAKEFADGFPSKELLEDAEKRLGKMFNRDDYPSAEEVRKRFFIDVEIKPIPQGHDFRVKLSDAATKAVIKDIEKRNKDKLQGVVDSVFEQVKTVVQAMSERLHAFDEGKGNFRDSLVFNIKDVADLIPVWNITEDKRLVDLQQRMLDDLAANSPIMLKADPVLRRKTQDKADKILAKVSRYLGA
jgi:hypothetical protein